VPKPRLLVDENLSPKIAAFLRERGYDAAAVRDVGLRGRPDTEIHSWAARHGRIVLTTDLDFGRTFLLRPGRAAGVIVLRRFPRRLGPLMEALDQALQAGLLAIPSLHAALVIATPAGFRVRIRR
jgi:uncharacterized protein with PIN domain